MNHAIHNAIVNFIWSIADDVLRDVYVRGKYRDVILPMTVIRRLDSLLEPTKEAVPNMKKQLDAAGIANQHAALCQASGQAFYNVSAFTLRDLKARAKQQQLKADFEAYLDGFSPNVQEILDKFKFRNQIPTLIEADILGHLIEKFLDSSITSAQNQSSMSMVMKNCRLSTTMPWALFSKNSFGASMKKTTRKRVNILHPETWSNSWLI